MVCFRKTCCTNSLENSADCSLCDPVLKECLADGNDCIVVGIPDQPIKTNTENRKLLAQLLLRKCLYLLLCLLVGVIFQHVLVSTLEVTVEKGTLVLRGVVRDSKQKKRVEEAAMKLAEDVPLQFNLHYRLE